MTSSTGIYIHVPFCGKKCSYCDFYSVCYSGQQAELYVQAVVRNLRHYGEKSLTADTVYFGGGTPSLLSGEQISRIMAAIQENFALSGDAEVTLEANPVTLSPRRLEELLSAGVNRLSIGVQSMNDAELRYLGRLHSAERAEKAVLDAFETGFRNISCDLMLALPGQSEELLKQSIDRLCALPIQHISAYILKVEEGTPFDCDEVRSALPDEEKVSQLYLFAVSELDRHGYQQYEVSNFSIPGYESRHNCRYWKCEDYLGIGPSAHSCHKGVRFAADADIQAFIDAPHQNVTITDPSPCDFTERAMLLLRLSDGLHLADFPQQADMLRKKVPPLVAEGYITFDGERIALTPRGFLVSNSVISFLIF